MSGGKLSIAQSHEEPHYFSRVRILEHIEREPIHNLLFLERQSDWQSALYSVSSQKTLMSHPRTPENCLPNRATSNAAIALLLFLLFVGCDRGREITSTDKPVLPPIPKLLALTNMVLIKPGTFIRMKHLVTLTNEYWLGKFEVTQGEYLQVMRTNPSYFPGDLNRPVEKVSYLHAVEYCAAITKREREAGHLPPEWEYRLPTEAEWEFGCRGGTTNLFNFGDDQSKADQYAWTAENSDSTTHPIGQKLPSSLGLYDIHGNVWEWCQDWFALYPQSDSTNPVGPPQGKFKVFRGGGWNNEAQYARSANRFMMAPASGTHFVGLRLALCQIPVGLNQRMGNN
jgi:formylglycine-generating enzyme required for sulfatase activity